MLRFHRKFKKYRIGALNDPLPPNWSDADGDGVLPTADGARGPWQRTPAGDGGIGMVIAPVSLT